MKASELLQLKFFTLASWIPGDFLLFALPLLLVEVTSVLEVLGDASTNLSACLCVIETTVLQGQESNDAG